MLPSHTVDSAMALSLQVKMKRYIIRKKAFMKQHLPMIRLTIFVFPLSIQLISFKLLNGSKKPFGIKSSQSVLPMVIRALIQPQPSLGEAQKLHQLIFSVEISREYLTT
nr:unnamed protein product [Bacillus sp.] [Bacillus sp. (in: firmicutes)]